MPMFPGLPALRSSGYIQGQLATGKIGAAPHQAALPSISKQGQQATRHRRPSPL
ncbi:hypothetical protein BDA96_08G200000 [Sorghum bicolor]|uniref:Uncharacterized protein n=1 Tax=Sorghum bicolor TaxID=4558 RepID=A0A921QHL0_SORBI|nr:hypothetical protein BDA96_08G200000 [Sorghum bicolor]KAG0521883.1 hypothetical protein BDA96_08G200000 [Sorghum bicolor]